MGFALSSVLWLVPGYALLALASRDGGRPGLAMAGLVTYPVLVALAGPHVERWRARILLGEPVAPGPATIGRSALYALVNFALAAVEAGLVLGLGGRGGAQRHLVPHLRLGPLPDPAWGGPSPLGAVALHVGVGLVVLFLVPGLVARLTRLHAALVRRWLTVGRVTPSAPPDRVAPIPAR
jgi:hypothetical protein